MKNILATVSKLTGRTGLKIQKASPEILLVLGVTGIVASTVLACKATLKCEDVMTLADEKFGKIKDTRLVTTKEQYSDLDYQRDMSIAYIQTGADLLKLYAPAISLGALSIMAIVGSHGILKQRNVALVAAYKALNEGYSAYRKRVIEDYGAEKDYMYKHNLRQEMVTETETDEEGKSKKVKKTKLIPMNSDDPNKHSVYARFYDDGCTQWTKVPEYNLMFLKTIQNNFNDLLRVRGHVFLNEVYDALGIERTTAGQIVGWVYDPENGIGDNYIDFGIFDKHDKSARAFVNGYENVILLDFNVDGVVYDML